MIKSKTHEIFCDSISKLNSIICSLDKQLGLVSDAAYAIDHQSNTTINLDKEKNKHISPLHHKKEKKETKKTETPQINQKNTSDDIQSLFNECDIRVGKVVELTNMENSDKVYILKIDLGGQNLRTIGTGLRKFVPPEELLGKTVLVFANLKPKKFPSFVSEGMVLTAHREQGDQFEVPRAPEGKLF